MDSRELNAYIQETVNPLYKSDKARYEEFLAEGERLWREWLFEEYGSNLSENSEKIFSQVWSNGHSSGYSEVEHHFSELTELVRECMK